jgi:hypothetical protein
MQFRKGTIQREIEAAAIALGFPKQVSYRQVERECFQLHARLRRSKAIVNPGPERDRWLAMANLLMLMELSRTLDSRIAALRSDLIERSKRVRELVAKAAA